MTPVQLALAFGLGFGLPVSAFVQPTVGITWDYSLGYTFASSNADSSTKFYSVDLVNTAQKDITALKAAGHIVACYFSGGSVEDFRSDAKDFPAAAVGKVMDGWPHEKWVDTRNDKVRQIMVARIAQAQSKGCDGVDVDNIDGYSNDTGFDMDEDDAVDFIQAMADAAHAKNLAYGLKNGGDLIDQVKDDVQWAINEQCVQYNECAPYKVLLDAKKPVFHVEYTKDDAATTVDASFLKSACAAGGLKGVSTIVKHNSLDKWIKKCS